MKIFVSKQNGARFFKRNGLSRDFIYHFFFFSLKYIYYIGKHKLILHKNLQFKNFQGQQCIQT